MTKRYEFVVVPEDWIIDLLNWTAGGLPDAFTWPHFAGLPADAAVDAITYDFARRAFVVRVLSESFGEVLPCAAAPVREGPMTPERLTVLIRQNDGTYRVHKTM